MGGWLQHQVWTHLRGLRDSGQDPNPNPNPNYVDYETQVKTLTLTLTLTLITCTTRLRSGHLEDLDEA